MDRGVVPVFIAGELIRARTARLTLEWRWGRPLAEQSCTVLVLWAGTFVSRRNILRRMALAASFRPRATGMAGGIPRPSFETGWLQAIGIVAVGWLVLFVMDVILTSFFGVSFPKFYPF